MCVDNIIKQSLIKKKRLSRLTFFSRLISNKKIGRFHLYIVYIYNYNFHLIFNCNLPMFLNFQN